MTRRERSRLRASTRLPSFAHLPFMLAVSSAVQVTPWELHMKFKALATLLALPLLAACAPEIESTVYLADVQTALDKGEAVSIPAVLRIPQGGEDECKKGLDALIEKLKALAPVTGKGQCISKDQH